MTMTIPEDTAATITGLDLEPEWQCCGCGKPAPDREQTCHCRTAAIRKGDSKSAPTHWARYRGIDYDPANMALVEHFLPKGRPAQKREMARMIQAAVEDFFKGEDGDHRSLHPSRP